MYSVVIEYEVEIRGFYTASDVLFYGERYLCNFLIHARIRQGDFLCFSYVDMIIEKDYLARFRVDFVTILKFCRVKFQNPAGTTGIAAQFFFGKHDFHCGCIFNSRIFQGNVFRFFQRYEQRNFVLFENIAVYRVYEVSPLRALVVEYKTIIRIFDSFIDKPCLGKFHSYRATRVVQCNCFRFEDTDIFGVDNG